MKISQVLLRWHKSFNINYNGYDDRLGGESLRPWNALNIPGGDPSEFGFIEIPLESDVTTVVGANESGKSHLLDAVCKVLTGSGDDDRASNAEDKLFSVTDLCHFASVRSKDADVWPNIGLQFSDVKESDAKSLLVASGAETNANLVAEIVSTGFVLILAPTSEEPESVKAHIYVGETSFELKSKQLISVRGLLPKVKFLRSNLPLVDEISLPTLISAMGGSATYESYEANSIHGILSKLSGLEIPAKNQVDNGFSASLQALKDEVAEARINGGQAGQLEAMLFRDVLGVKMKTLQKIASLRTHKRSYVENLIGEWNRLLAEELNLSRYWQQDPSFVLRINYKGGMLYFEITDKTGSIYTFGERSSGLRYFLSYYIQAKALEKATRQGRSVILMDEPDSFLSTQGQRNLLMVFESLVESERTEGNTQLVYTTHSPWLINRNYPQRIRLVRKGDAEEGTQYIHSPVLRRYEPVRSALGVDCAQTLFMGATNLVLEGATDQYLLTELIRSFATSNTLWRYLDLNSLVTVSADSAERIEQVLVASKWGDEIQPATVVLLDKDEQGQRVFDRITKPRYEWDEAKGEKKDKPSPALLEPKFVITVADLLGPAFTAGKFQTVVSIEDMVPAPIYAEAVREYMRRWQPDLFEAKSAIVNGQLAADEFGSEGVAKGVSKIFEDCGLPRKFDKFGVAQEVVRLVKKRGPESALPFDELDARLQASCRVLQSAIEASEQAQRTNTGQSNVRRLLRDFQKGKQRAPVRQVIHLFERLGREIDNLGEDGENLQNRIAESLKELSNLEAAKIEKLDGDSWGVWNAYLNTLQRDPLGTVVPPPNRAKLMEASEPAPASAPAKSKPAAAAATRESAKVASTTSTD